MRGHYASLFQVMERGAKDGYTCWERKVGRRTFRVALILPVPEVADRRCAFYVCEGHTQPTLIDFMAREEATMLVGV